MWTPLTAAPVAKQALKLLAQSADPSNASPTPTSVVFHPSPTITEQNETNNALPPSHSALPSQTELQEMLDPDVLQAYFLNSQQSGPNANLLLQPNPEQMTREVALGNTIFLLSTTGSEEGAIPQTATTAYGAVPIVLGYREARPGEETDTSPLGLANEAYYLQAFAETEMIQVEDENGDVWWEPRAANLLDFENVQVPTPLSYVVTPDTSAMDFLETPEAPEVLALQAQLSEQTEAVLQRNPALAELSLEDIQQNPRLLEFLPASELAALTETLGGRNLPRVMGHRETKRLLGELYDNQPDTHVNLPILAAYRSEEGEDPTAVVFNRTPLQNEVLSLLQQEHTRRSVEVARVAAEGLDVQVEDLPYSEQELLQMGIDPNTYAGQLLMATLKEFEATVGGPENLRELIDPEQVTFSMGYNPTQNDRLDFQAPITLASVISSHTQYVQPITVAETVSDYLQAYLPPDTLVVNPIRDPNQQVISFNLDFVGERTALNGRSVVEELHSALANELGNNRFNQNVGAQAGITGPLSFYDERVVFSTGVRHGPVGELTSDIVDAWLAMGPEYRAYFSELAQQDPEAALQGLLAYQNATITDASNIYWSGMDPEVYHRFKASGALSEAEALIHRLATVYMAVNGSTPVGFTFDEHRQASFQAFEQTLLDFGLPPELVAEYSAFLEQTLLPEIVLASTETNAASGQFGDTPEEHRAQILRLANN